MSAKLLVPGGARERTKKSIFRDEEGSLIIYTLFLLFAVFLVAGLAVDLMRAETDRTRLQSTLDRAVLAGAALGQKLDPATVTRDYFVKAGLGDYVTDIKVTPGNGSRRVTASAVMQTESLFTHLLGINQWNAPAAGAAEEAIPRTEVSLVLDISGSMYNKSSHSGNRKIVDLQEAAKEFVDLMVCGADTPGGKCKVKPNTVSITIVPYAEQVTVGEKLLQQFTPTEEHQNSSCVDFDSADFEKTAIPLKTRIKRSAELDRWTSYRRWSQKSTRANYWGRSCRADARREIKPLSNNISDLKTYIGNLSAGGNTSIDIGMKWGVALLDPAFRPAAANLATPNPKKPDEKPMVPATFSNRPYDYASDITGPEKTTKVVVLMTDGQNTEQGYVRNSYRSGLSPFYMDTETRKISAVHWFDHNGNKEISRDELYWYRHFEGAKYKDHGVNHKPYPYRTSGSTVRRLTWPQYWRYFSGRAASNAAPWQEGGFWGLHGYTEKNNRLKAICGAAKDKDIKVYTIGFETTEASNAIMQECASAKNYHFDVNGLNLKEAFIQIARDVQQLRLVN